MRFVKDSFLIGTKNSYIRAAIEAANTGTCEELETLFNKYPDLYNMTLFPYSDSGYWQDHTIKEFYIAACSSGDLVKIDYVSKIIAEHAIERHSALPYNQACEYIGKAGNDKTCLTILERFEDALNQVDAVCAMYHGAVSEHKESTIQTLDNFFQTKCRDKLLLQMLDMTPDANEKAEINEKLKDITLSQYISLNNPPEDHSPVP